MAVYLSFVSRYVLFVTAVLVCETHCTNTSSRSSVTNADKKYLFASKTPYKLNTHTTNFLYNDNNYKNCEALQINALFRHGARNPKKTDISRTQDFFSKLKDASINQNIFHWTSQFKHENEKDITKVGLSELKYLGEMYRLLYDQISSSEKGSVIYISSTTNRTIGSCMSFISGFTNNLSASDTKDKCKIMNNLMRFFDVCKNYLIDVDDNIHAMKELKLFQEGNEIEYICSNIRSRHHLGSDFKITYKELKAAYTVAGTEMANFGESAWEKFFTAEELSILEYASDLKSYWKKSYGHRINYEQSCPLLVDIFSHLETAVQNKLGYHTGIFRFGHAETVIPILTILGLYQDETPLKASNYKQQLNRKFKTGKISQFAANLAFVLHKCKSESTDADGYKILLLHNEKPIHFPCCTEELLCPYQTVKEYYSRWLQDCDFDELCAMNRTILKKESHLEL